MSNLMARMKRHGINSQEELISILQFSAIMVLSDCVNIEMNVQIICDLVASKTGKLGQGSSDLRSSNDPQKVDLYISNADLEYADIFAWPRHGQGILNRSLIPIYE